MSDTEWGIDRTMHEQGREIDRLRAEVERLTGEMNEWRNKALDRKLSIDALYDDCEKYIARAEKAEREREEATSKARFWEQANADAVRVVHRNAVVLTEARARIRDLEAALRETHDALERLDAIYASEHDPDPVLGTVLRPAWLTDALRRARALFTPTAPEGDADKQPRAPGCQCHLEAGDSPCRVHGEEEGTAPEGGERVTMTIDVDALNAAPTVQCIRCNAPCSECATPAQKGAAK